MAANTNKVLLRSNSADHYGYNNSSANQHGSYKSSSSPKQFDCYNNSPSKQNGSFNKNTPPSNHDGTFNKPFLNQHESYNNVSAPHLRRSYSVTSKNSSYNLKQHGAKHDSESLHNIMPPIPPSPDISHLTIEELDILKRVFKREETFEKDEAERLREMECRLETYERAARQHAKGKGKLKYNDLRLCRLCHETKFVDGIGRVCHDCRRRVCVRCGSCDSSHWSPRKQKNVRGKWRCNMCQLKLEFVCQSGKWFHGNRSASMVNHPMINKIQFNNDVDTSDTDNQTSAYSSSCFSASETYTDPELRKFSKAMSGCGSKNMQNRNRRRSGSLLPRSSPSDNDSETDDSAERARTHVKQKRAQRRNSSRRKSLKQRQLLMDVPDQDNIYNDDLTSGYVVNGGNISPRGHLHSMQRLNVSSDVSDRARRHSDESVRSGSVSVYFNPDDSQTDESSSRKGSVTHPNPSNCCISPLQAGLPLDSWGYGLRSSQSPPLIGSGHRGSMPRLNPRSSPNTLTVGGRSSPSERRRHSHNIPISGVLGFKSDRKRFSVDQHTLGHKVKQTYLMPPESPASRCRRWSSDSGSSRRSSGNIDTAESTDWNEDIKGQEYLASLTTRDVLLYRDKNDQNCRCNGLGMRVVGGQCRYGNRLGAFVMYVDTDGPADSYGILEGDQVLVWNGKSLVDTTFEETKRIVNQSSEIVQLVVVHHDENYGMVEVTETADETEQEGNPSIAQPIPLPPSVLTFNKPKRRMLPKTPIEMKKEERLVSGKLQMSVSYSEDEECLSLTLVQADDLRPPGQLEASVINPIALVHLLPSRGFYPPYETIPQFNTSSPRWNETFNILDLNASEVNDKSIEITIWNQQHAEDMFLGEVLLDLVDANTKDETLTYDLEDHDENSSPLPRRRRKESCSDVTTTSQISPMTPTIDTSSNWSTSPSHLSNQNLNSEGKQNNEDRQSWSVPLPKRNTITRSGSFSAKMKRKLVVAVSKMSSTFSGSERRLSLQEGKTTTPNISHSTDAMLGVIVPPISISPRHSTDQQYKGQLLDINYTTRSHTCSEAGASIHDDNSDFDEMSKRFGSTSPDRPAPDGDDITSILGPAQVPPKPASEQSVCGDVRLGLMVTQGKLEIDIICVTGLLTDSENAPPDTYVKTYLVEGSKVIQKKKTSTIKASYEPNFNRKIKYSACNIHGRHIKVKIWSRQGAFDKKLCLGETVIKLDGLDLGQHTHTLSWYKLFPQGATDFSSNESLSF